jgi:hypothetical protein
MEAHSNEELAEWKARFADHQKQKSKMPSTYSEALMEKLMNAKNPETVVSYRH